MYILLCIYSLLTVTNTLSYSPSNPSINLTLYHNSAQLQQLINNAIINYTNVNKRTCKSDIHNYPILQIKSKNENASLSAVITCNVHARELFTSQACIHFIYSLLRSNDSKTNRIANSINFKIFYAANEMRDAVINGDYCRRTDYRDVDLNRNFPTGFLGQSEGKETNPGATPISQPFSICIQQQINSSKPSIFLDVHTGQFSLYYTKANTTDNAKQMKILNRITKNVCKNCRIRTDSQLQGVMYADYKIRKNIKWANLFQIYGGYNANLSQKQNCLVIFNPRTKRQYDFYIQRAKNTMVQYFIGILNAQQQNK